MLAPEMTARINNRTPVMSFPRPSVTAIHACSKNVGEDAAEDDDGRRDLLRFVDVAFRLFF